VVVLQRCTAGAEVQKCRGAEMQRCRAGVQVQRSRGVEVVQRLCRAGVQVQRWQCRAGAEQVGRGATFIHLN